jgi:hypothetical protein
MARVMRDVTVSATATKIFAACGPSELEDGYLRSRHWLIAVKAWSVGSTRALHYDDQLAISNAICALDAEVQASDRALEEDDCAQ